MKDFEYYIKVDLESKKILEIFDSLSGVTCPYVSGLEHLEERRLESLRWIGCDYGYIKINPNSRSRLNFYSYDEEVIKKFKVDLTLKLKEEKRKYIESGTRVNNTYSIILSDKNLLFLTMKYLYCIHNKGSNIDYFDENSNRKITMSSKMFIEIYERTLEFIDNASEIEFNIQEKINEAESLLDLFYINIKNIKWNSNVIEL